jgi:thiol-disulfide isomerase/thioredoxin
MYRLIATVLILAAGSTRMLATEPTLKVGDPAPKLQTGKWLQGEPVEQFEKGKAYIVEFWATWCGPCRDFAPHLSEIQKKYEQKGLIVIGQDYRESDESLVASFLKSMGDKVTYRIALDDKTRNKKGAMAEAWMTAAGKDGIPTAFLVDTKGFIAWIGHPLEFKQKLIEEVLAGRFDVKQAAEEYGKRQRDSSQVQAEMKRVDYLVGHDKNYSEGYKLVEQLSATHKEDIMLQATLATQVWRYKQLDRDGLAVLEKIATRAGEAATDSADSYVLDSVAAMSFDRGLKEKAVELLEKAVQLADESEKATCQKALDNFKKGRWK